MRAKRVDLLSLLRGLIPIGSMFGNYRLSKYRIDGHAEL